ncbi:MAG: cytochrome c3 family protein [Myxococcales bacterium]
MRAILCALAIASPALAAARKAPAGPGGDCMSCHAEQYVKKQVVHPPVKNGLCAACHVSQSETEHVFALAADGKQLCRQCHGPRDTQKVLHNPVNEGLCLFCHDPHASDNYVRLRRTVFDTCTTCHPSKRLQNAAAFTKHGALDPAQNDKVCVACHDAHQSDHEKRLKAWPPMNVCFGCHNKQLDTPTGKIMNMKEWVESNPENEMRHGPVREGMCPKCHEPHGTDNWRMLKASFPGEFYAPLKAADETYALCFGCHDRRLLETQKLAEKGVSNKDYSKEVNWGDRPEGQRLLRAGITGFRNGEENLHFKHVNKIDKGRTCRACHDFHASPNPKHIKTQTKFGNWEFKLNYQKTETGGSCWPGCHVQRKYDRTAKQENPR